MNQVGLNSNALTTLETVKALLNIPSEEEAGDNNLIRLINAASSWVETRTGRKFDQQTYTERHAASGSQQLLLRQYPVVSVEYVKDLGAGIICPDEYSLLDNGEYGALFKETGWPYRGYAQGLAGDMRMPARYLEVRYTAGYVLPKDATEDKPATIPNDLESVVWGIVEQEYLLRTQGAQGLSAFSINDVSWTFDKAPKQSWIDTIKCYERW